MPFATGRLTAFRAESWLGVSSLSDLDDRFTTPPRFAGRGFLMIKVDVDLAHVRWSQKGPPRLAELR
jgi:hypothetical protein